MDSGRLCPDVCYTRYYDRNQAENFFTVILAFFLKLCVFNNLLEVGEAVYNFHKDSQNSLKSL